ncbi:MAG: ISNCY family transposase [Longimicrobiales bacterium]
MRRHEQLSLERPYIEHNHAGELAKISQILTLHPDMAKLVEQDLVRGLKCPETGARGMSGDQVLRALLLKQMNGFSYRELEFHLADSVTYRTFCRFGALEPTPSRATLAENLKKVRAETLEAIGARVVRYAAEVGVERGRKVRVDSTVVEANVHAPTDSSLLWDGVRVLTRLMGQAGKHFGFELYTDHTRRAKRRMREIQDTGSKRKRTAAYRDLLKVGKKSVGYAGRAVAHLEGVSQARAQKLADELTHYVGLLRRVIEQTERRVLRGEKVPPTEKLVSLFEPHTDIIVKDRRDTFYGHKIFLTGGASGLILDCVVEVGNPADATMALPMLERQTVLYGRPPRQAAFDGGFASKENLKDAKASGVEDVAFSKRRGLKVSDMTRSSWVYRRLRNFRAGIEGLISFLKRAFGLDRCTWRGAESFASYVQASVLTANLLTLARHLLA